MSGLCHCCISEENLSTEDIMSLPLICHVSVRRISQQARSAQTRALVDKVIRIDHAGELGADRIYAGQHAVLSDTASGPVIKVTFM